MRPVKHLRYGHFRLSKAMVILPSHFMLCNGLVRAGPLFMITKTGLRFGVAEQRVLHGYYILLMNCSLILELLKYKHVSLKLLFV